MSDHEDFTVARRATLADEFERQRPYLRAVAYRMLGSVSEADDALQETWLRLDRRPPDTTDALRPWLTAVIGRICLDMLRARRRRREDYADSSLPEPIVDTASSPEDESLVADSVGLALLVVLDTLSPPERLAFVLHDVFAVPFDDIADVVGRSPDAARQLASRARRRVQAANAEPTADLEVERRIVDAFLAASRSGDFEALLKLLDPNVVLRADVGERPGLARPSAVGAAAVLETVRTRAHLFVSLCRPATVNGRPGLIVGPPGSVIGVVGFGIADGKIREIDVVADRAKLRRLPNL